MTDVRPDFKLGRAGTHCKRGHEYTPENTYVNVRGARECRTCSREHKRAYKQKLTPQQRTKYKAAPKRKPAVCDECGATRLVFGPAGRTCKPCQFKAMRTGKTAACAECGTDFYVKRGQVGRIRHCSVACANKAKQKSQARTRLGKANPAFKHGLRAGVQIRGWHVERKGEDSCRNCGATDKRLHLHHAIPRSKCRATREDIRNGVPLCTTCHAGWHNKKLTLYRDLFTADEWAYISSATLTGERIEAWLDRNYPVRPLEAAA